MTCSDNICFISSGSFGYVVRPFSQNAVKQGYSKYSATKPRVNTPFISGMTILNPPNCLMQSM